MNRMSAIPIGTPRVGYCDGFQVTEVDKDPSDFKAARIAFVGIDFDAGGDVIRFVPRKPE